LAEASNLERVANILKNEAGLQSDVGVESEPIVTGFVICTRGAQHRIPQPLLLHKQQPAEQGNRRTVLKARITVAHTVGVGCLEES
jgi:hypothetical protein